VLEALQADFGEGVEMRSSGFVGAAVGEELTEQGILAVIYALIGIFIYVMFRFQWRFSVGAVLAVVHDILVVLGSADELQPLLDRHALEMLSVPGAAFADVAPEDLTLFEGIVSGDSPLVGRGVPFLRRRSGGGLALYGLSRHGEMLRKRLRRVTFRIGDILLLQGKEGEVDENITQFGLLPLAPRPLSLMQKRRAGIALLVFAAAILVGMLKLMPLYMAFLLAIMAYLLLGILPVRQLYDEVDWPVIVLLGAMIPIGQAPCLLARYSLRCWANAASNSI
jgi:hypothetical protein